VTNWQKKFQAQKLQGHAKKSELRQNMASPAKKAEVEVKNADL